MADQRTVKVVTVAVDKYGSTCPVALPFKTRKGHRTATKTKHHQRPTSGALTACLTPFCPSLNARRCIDNRGVVHTVRCDATLQGSVIYSPGHRKRAYATDFNECLRNCDASPACRGASFESGDCVLFATLIGFAYNPGSVAAVQLSFPYGNSSLPTGIGGTFYTGSRFPTASATAPTILPSTDVFTTVAMSTIEGVVPPIAI